MSARLARGRVVVDIAGTELTTAERARLLHPQVGGVILFSRNFHDVSQLRELTHSIHALRTPPLIIGVDHEGGRVQRFRDGFTSIPPMRALGNAWERDQDRALGLARECGYVIATELSACGIDLSFTPVLDLDCGVSSVIGDRSFHADPDAVAALASALRRGLADGGMPACGKHFPGHGHVAADSHLAIPVDDRTLDEIEAADIVPFRRLVAAGLEAVMPAHVIYACVDEKPAGFSSFWLDYLRGRLYFDGIIFSDDLSMEGARAAGGAVDRGLAALKAGCDMVLLCNAPSEAEELLAGLASHHVDGVDPRRVEFISRSQPSERRTTMVHSERLARAMDALARIS